jgi:hypothetical protein
LAGGAALLVGVGLLAGSATARQPVTAQTVATGQVGTTWTLVNTLCKAGQVETGRACFDPAGHASEWAAVNEGSANSNTTGYTVTYTYTLPETIVPGGQNQVILSGNVSNVTNGGAHARVCATLPFSKKESAEPCATTAEAANGQSAAQTTTLTLVPFDAAAGTKVTLSIGFEEPGGQLYFTYQARAPQRARVSYHFRGDYVAPKVVRVIKTLKIVGAGSFEVDRPLDAGPLLPGHNPRGSALIQLQYAAKPGVHSAELALTRAQYTGGYRQLLKLTYRVTRSTTACLPVGRQLQISALDAPVRDELSFSFCYAERLQRTVDVRIKSG